MTPNTAAQIPNPKKKPKDFIIALMLELFELSRFFIGKRVPAAGTWILKQPKRFAPNKLTTNETD